MTRLASAAVALLAASLAAGGAAPVQAQPVASQAVQYDIPPSPLADALNRFALQSGTAIAVDANLLRGLRTPGLQGRHGLEEGFALLLRGSGYAAEKTAQGYVLRPVPPASPAPRAAAEPPAQPALPAVHVKATADAETATGPLAGYAARRSATATKTDTPLIESPQSVTVVGAAQIEAMQPASITEALGYAAGVFRSEDVDATRDQMRVRGFDLDAEFGSYFRDGLKYTVNGFNGQQEPYGLERIELLRGASSVLYGLSAPGGLVNTVSKRPTAEPLRELNVAAGSFHRKQVSGDFAGKLTQDGVWTYRLTGLRRDSGTFIDHTPDDRTYLAPALKWQPSAATSLTLLSDYQHDVSAYNPGLPVSGTLLPNRNGQLPVDRFLGEPGVDRYDNTRYSAGYLFEHAFSGAFKLRHSLRYFHSKNTYTSTWSGLELDAVTERVTTARGVQHRHDESSAVTSDTSVQAQWQNGAVAHTLLAGLDITRAKHQSQRFEAEAGQIDVFAPAYGAPIGDYSYLNYSWKARSTRLGAYLQDQVKVADRWVATVGGRQDWVRDDRCAFAMPELCPVDNEKSQAFTGRAGLVYLAGNGMAPFASFSQSWEPTSGVARDGGRFEPTTGEQFEAGLRYQPEGSGTLLSASIYQLTRKNVLVDDPVNASSGDYFQVQRGEVRSRGVELEAKARVGKQAQVLAAYAYTDARTVKSSPLTPELDGKRTGGVPRHQMSVWADRTLAEWDLPGLKLGLGLRHVGSTTGLWTDLVTPSYTVADALVSYTGGPWRWAVNVSNLTDKTYLALCPYRCFYGEPRKVTATASYRW